MEISERHKNKIAIVSGGANGIGKAVAQRLGREGAIVAVFDLDRAELDNVVKDLQQQHIEASGYYLNVGSEAEVLQAVQAVYEKYGRIDILIHAAGIVGPTSTNITDYATLDFDKIYEVNLKGTFLIAKFTLQVMEKVGSGRLLLISSIAGKEGNPGMVGYSATKAGVIGLVKGVAKEFATTHITVNGLAPSVIETPMNRNTSPDQLAYMKAKIPMQRLGTVEEVAALSCFIVSDENSFSTGFIYDISGGRATY